MKGHEQISNFSSLLAVFTYIYRHTHQKQFALHYPERNIMNEKSSHDVLTFMKNHEK